MANLLATKSIKTLLNEAHETGEHCLKRSLGPSNLIALGIGAIVGTGIFVITGTATALHAGPAVILSFIFAAVGCVFAGLCYAEFSSMIPVAGSAYTYGYATLGEIFAWIIGWDLHASDQRSRHHPESYQRVPPGAGPVEERRLDRANPERDGRRRALHHRLDMAKYEVGLSTEKILKRAPLDQMWIPIKLNGGGTFPQGLCWRIDDVNGHRLAWKDGVLQGYTTVMSRYLDDHLTVVVLTNLGESEGIPKQIADSVAAIYLPALKVKE